MTGGWRSLWLVARREWDQRVRSLSFRLSTLLSILIVVALIAVPEMYGGGSEPTHTVGLVGDSGAELPASLRSAGEEMGLSVRVREFADESSGRAALRSEDISALLVDQRDLVWRAEVDQGLQAAVISAVQALDRREAIAELGLTSEEAGRLIGPPDLRSTSLEPAAAERSARRDLGFVAVVMLFMAIAFYGGFVLVGVVEEKSSRVVEVLLARIRPAQLLGGKILGIGLVGLAQFALVVGSALVAVSLSGNTLLPSTTPSTLGWILFWFVTGYAFYSVLFATAGSLISRQEEAQSVQFPVTAFLLVGYVVAFQAAAAPEGVAALVGSLLPPTAPMVMTVLMAQGGVAWWHVALSAALLMATTYGMVLLAGRLYSGAVLRLGRRVRLREAWRGAEG